MKKLNLYKLYLALAIIVLIILASISSYFIIREIVSKKYIDNKTYISMFYNDYYFDECKYDIRENKIKDTKKIQTCIKNKEKVFLDKREYRYKFNMVKYGVLLFIVFILLGIHSILYIRKK